MILLPLSGMCFDDTWDIVCDKPGEPVQHYATIIAEEHGSPAGIDEYLVGLFCAAPDMHTAILDAHRRTVEALSGRGDAVSVLRRISIDLAGILDKIQIEA